MVGVTVEAITMLLDQHHEALVEEFKNSFSLLETKFDQVWFTVKDHCQRLASVSGNNCKYVNMFLLALSLLKSIQCKCC